MARRKGEVHEIHRAETEVQGEGARNDLAPGADYPSDGHGDAAERAEFGEGDQPRAELVANESQQGEGASPFTTGADEGTQEQDRGLAEQPELPPQVPAGNPTEREEIKRRNFSRVAGGRVTRILDGLRLLKHCANTATYEWDRAQHEKIFDAIEELVAEVESAFTKAKQPRTRSASQKQPRFEL